MISKLAVALFSVILSLGGLWLIPTPVSAPSPCSAFAVCIHAGVFQPVQAVWQDDMLYPPSDTAPGGPGGLPYIDSGDNIHWNATFPMIAGKNTYLFGTLNDYDANRSTIDIFVSDTIPGGGTDPVQLQISVTPPGTVIFTSATFMVPRGGAILYTLPAPLPLIPFQFNGSGPHEIRMKTILTNSANQLIVHTYVKKQGRGLGLYYVPIAFAGDIAPGGGPMPGVTLPTGNDFNAMVQQSSRFIQAAYPLNETGLQVTVFPSLITYPNPATGAGDFERYKLFRDDFQKTARILERMTGLLEQIVVVVPDYHAHLPDKSWKQHWFGGTVLPGEAYEPGGAPNVLFVEQGYWEVVAHEVLHNILRADHDQNVADGYWVNANRDQPDGAAPAVCNPDASGFAAVCTPRASLQNVPVATAADTIIFYHSLSGLWPAKKNVSASFQSLFDPLRITDPEVVVVSGSIFANKTGSFDNFYRFSQGTPSLALGSVGNYTIAFRDATGSLLAIAGFNVSLTFNPAAFEPNPSPVTLNPTSFNFVLPWVTGTKTIQLVNSTGYTLASKSVSSNALSITVNSPSGGEAFPSGSIQTVSWTAGGVGGATLAYNAFYSGDNGTSWIPIGQSTTGTSVAWNLTGVPAGTKYLVRVIATDGVNTGDGVSSNNFSVVPASIGDFSVSATSACSGSNCATVGSIILTTLAGFSGTVTLTDTVPYALNCGPITPGSVTIPPSPASATLSCSSLTVGNYTVTVTATSEGIVHSTNLTFTCPTIGPACSSTVGGRVVPVNKLALPSLYLGSVSLLVAAILAIVCLRRSWRRTARRQPEERLNNPGTGTESPNGERC